MNFGNWDENIHNDYQQIKRIVTMQQIKSANVTVFPEKQTAKIIGRDGVYDVTLNTCTCIDFSMRQLTWLS